VTSTPNPRVQTQAQVSFLEKFATPDLTMTLVVLIWGCNFAVVKTALAQIAPLPFTAIRFVIATSMLALLLRWREGDCSFPREGRWSIFWLGIIGNTAYQALFASGLARTTSANASLILTATPATIALIGGLIGVERVTRHLVAGIALAMGGVAVVMAPRGASLSSQTLVGDLLVFASVFGWTAYVLGIRQLGNGLSSLRATTLTMITGTPGLVLLGLPGMLRTDWSRVGGATAFGLFYSAALALVVCYLLYNRNVRLIGGVRTTIYGCAIPMIAALVAWPMLGEKPTATQGVGAILIIVGVLVTRRK
jgi:drug/metabolite transporter (DMT)-like permease